MEERTCVKHFRNNADLRREIKHGGRSDGEGRGDGMDKRERRKKQSRAVWRGTNEASPNEGGKRARKMEIDFSSLSFSLSLSLSLSVSLHDAVTPARGQSS